MELILSGKHLEIEDTDRALAQKLADQLDADYQKLNSLRMVLSAEHGRAMAEAILTGKNTSLNASAVADSVPVAIAAACEKLDKQMRRFLEKLQDRSMQADPKLKEKIWTSSDLKKEDDAEADIFE
ncbi:MAG: HPF/RaiA family ribosome-associated protein [Victivallales bacterium]|nr:HPF/RaiA family ribosome-associated protein [Victivallales bacterium]